MVFLGGAVLANIVSKIRKPIPDQHADAAADGGQGKHVDLKARMGRTRQAGAGEARRKMIEQSCLFPKLDMMIWRVRVRVVDGHAPRPDPSKGGLPQQDHLVRSIRGCGARENSIYEKHEDQFAQHTPISRKASPQMHRSPRIPVFLKILLKLTYICTVLPS